MKTKLIFLAILGALGISKVSAQVLQQPQAIPAAVPTTAPIPFGQVLDVVPYVSADGYTIQINIVPTFTEFLGYDQDSARLVRAVIPGVPVQDTPLPRYRVRQVATSAIVWDGQTVVLGGLISEDVSRIKDKVPVLGDLPFAGRFFRSESSRTLKRNLMIFVTPTIIDPAGNRVHSDEELPFAQTAFPPQTPIKP